MVEEMNYWELGGQRGWSFWNTGVFDNLLAKLADRSIIEGVRRTNSGGSIH